MSTLSRWLALIAAVAPVALVTAVLLRPEAGIPPAPPLAARAINGRSVIDGDVGTWIADRMDRRRPRVVVLGNSIAAFDVDADALAEALGMPGRKLEIFAIPGSIGSHWYAILENLVYGRGHRPELVLVVADLQSVLGVVPESAAIGARLEALLDDDDPLIRQRLGLGRSDRRWTDRVAANRPAMRRALLGGVRDAAASLAAPHGTPDRRAWGHEAAEVAVERVFGEPERTPARAPEAARWPGVGPADVPPPERSFVPDLAALAARHGSRLVVVRAPVSPHLAADQADPVLPGVTDAVRAQLELRGAQLFDLSDRVYAGPAWRDPLHLRPATATRFSESVGAYVLENRPRPPRFGVTNRGPPVAPPGGRVVLEAVGRDTLTGSAVVVLQGMGGTPADATVTLDDRPATALVGEPGDRLRVSVSLPRTEDVERNADGGTAVHRLVVEAPADGPALRVVAAFLAGDAWFGAPGDARGASRPAGSAVVARSGPLDVAPEAADTLHIWRAAALTGAIDRSPELPWAGCAPLRVTAGGSPVPEVGCRAVHGGAAGSCWDGDRLVVRADGPVDVALAPGRACGDATWILPGDRIGFPVSAGEPASRLMFRVTAGGTPDGVTVAVDETRVAWPAPASGSVTVLDVPARADAVTVWFENAGAAAVLVRDVALLP